MSDGKVIARLRGRLHRVNNGREGVNSCGDARSVQDTFKNGRTNQPLFKKR